MEISQWFRIVTVHGKEEKTVHEFGSVGGSDGNIFMEK
jgi:hypothetical protein